jgi:hypothetical protein
LEPDLIQKDLVDLPGDRELGLQLASSVPGRSELDRLTGASAIDLAAIDLLLLEPVLDRRIAHPKRRRKLLDARSGTTSSTTT